jgi:ferredoxin
MLVATGAQKALVGIEDNKPEAIAAMSAAARMFRDIEVRPVPARYPMGSEKHLFSELTGQEVPADGRTTDLGALVHNVGTAYAVYEALCKGRPLVERIVTVNGDAIAFPGNIRVPVGTLVEEVLAFAGLKEAPARLVMGGPMMGSLLPQVRVPVVKGTSGLLALTAVEAATHDAGPCIRCSSCVRACPVGLLPLEMLARIAAGALSAAVDLGLKDCIACGCCAYVCPSRIPLVQYFNHAKGELAAQGRAQLRNEAAKRRISLAASRANKFAIDWSAYTPPKPSFLGTRAFADYPLAELVPYIDWTPFFQTWELVGRYPAILKDNKVGAEAQKLFNDAQDMLKRMVAEKWVRASGVVGFWPANSTGDDITLYTDETRKHDLATLYTLRQQIARDPGRDRAHTALADFIAPKETGIRDYIGAFAVTAGIGEEAALESRIPRTDDYSRIMLKALCDRLAEAFAERMHERVRKEFWGYVKAERLTNDELIAEKYVGIRPAPGYPAQPDHTEKAALWQLMNVEHATGITLTESYAMWPGASVSGLYFSHPDSHYFGVGKIERDQVEDYARRKAMSVEEVERWLAPVLNYDPRAQKDQAA